jgi:spermidine synthase
MKPREFLGTASIPGGEDMRLFRRGDDFMIVLDRNELMNTRMSGSEIALAEMTCQRLEVDTAPHILVGGYGMGFTLRAALAMLPPKARITVAELVPEIIEWARGPMAALTAGCLDDPRVALVMGDVGLAIGAAAKGTTANSAAESRYDAILLDVDNGPDGLTRVSNDWLYTKTGLVKAKAALNPDGILAIWSAAPDVAFAKRLRDTGFSVEEVTVRARSNGKGAKHVIWFARVAAQ